MLLAFGILLSAIWTNFAYINVAYAQVSPSVQSPAAPPVTTGNNAAAPFSLPSMKPDNNVTIAKSGPIAVAGPDQIVKEGSTVTLNGSQSVDPYGIILSYSWRQIPTNHIITLNGANTPVWSFTAPKVSSDTTFTFELTVTDNNGTTNNRTVNVLVKHSPSTSDQLAPPPSIAGVVPPQTPLTNNPQPIEGTNPTPIVNGNTPPVKNISEPLVANANPDKIINKGSIVTLDGTHSTGTIASYSWKQIGGKSVKLVSADALKSTFIAPSVKKDSPLKFMLTIDDGKGKTATVAVNVLVLKDSSKSTHSKG
jgi:hypothetical protein